MSTMKAISVGTILVNTIACGYDDFWQVVSVTPKSVTARQLEYKCINQKNQTHDKIPIKNKFYPPQRSLAVKRGGKHKIVDGTTVTLRVVEDPNASDGLRIGPMKRLNWWRIWDGTPRNQYSD